MSSSPPPLLQALGLKSTSQLDKDLLFPETHEGVRPTAILYLREFVLAVGVWALTQSRVLYHTSLKNDFQSKEVGRGYLTRGDVRDLMQKRLQPPQPTVFWHI